LLFGIKHAACAGGVAKAEGASAARRAGWQPQRCRFHISMSATPRVFAAVESIDGENGAEERRCSIREGEMDTQKHE
jgi:hypothetical protein